MDKDEAKALYENVGRILWEIWDPIGVREMGGPSDEYDSYRASVVRLLLNGADEQAIASHLKDLAETRMGVDAGLGTEVAAKALTRLLSANSAPS